MIRVLWMAAMGFIALNAWGVPRDSTTLSPEESNGMRLEDVFQNKTFEANEDITDLELRAQAGSLTRYSLKFEMDFSGPPVNDLGNPDHPNPDQRPGDIRTHLSGNMSLRYRLDSSTALNLGTGVKWFTPVQTVGGQSVDRPANSKNYDVSDPEISYDKTYGLGPQLQLRSAVKVAAITEDYFVQRGEWGSAGVQQAFKFMPRQSRFELGVRAMGQYYTYDREYRTGNRHSGGDGNMYRYFMLFLPSVEYRLRDALNLNTSLAYPYMNARASASWWNWKHEMSSWRVGLGWAIRRDIYFNPFVSFYAEAPAFTTASLSFNTVFSIF